MSEQVLEKQTGAEGARRVEVKRSFRASAEAVWAAWTDPEAVKQWWGCKGSECREARVDPVVGGEFLVRMRHLESGADMDVVGRFTQVDRPWKLVFTWIWEGNEAMEIGETTVEVALVERPDGTTDLTLVHSGFPDDETAQLHDQGWCGALEKLEGHLAG